MPANVPCPPTGAAGATAATGASASSTGVSVSGATVYTLSPGSDANGDGKVDNKDIVRLKNYLANYDENSGVSSNGSTVYILGPKQ